MTKTQWNKIEQMTAGGQAEIWLAENNATGELVVVKTLFRTPQLDDPEAELRRFYREVRCQSTLSHRGIMPILGYDFETEQPYYVMPKADETLIDIIAQNPGGMAPEDAASIIFAVIDAVAYAHDQGVIHRDLKPGNILRVGTEWLVGDFGLCRDLASDSTTFTKMNTVVGTVAYMAPEQYDDGHEADERADVFSLGRVIYHLLTGRVPFPNAPLDRLPPQFKYVFAKATADNPSDRYATVSELGRQLSLLIKGNHGLAEPVERGKELLHDVLSGDAEVVTLLDHILTYSNEEIFLQQFVPSIPAPVLAELQAAHQDGFREIVRAYDEYSDRGHPFSYVDVIADFFANIFALKADPMIRSLALRRIMIVGASHNRFYVGDVFADSLSSLTEPDETLMALNVLQADVGSAYWYRGYIKGKSLPLDIKKFFDDIT